MGAMVFVFSIWFLYDIAKSQNKSLLKVNDVRTLFYNLGNKNST